MTAWHILCFHLSGDFIPLAPSVPLAQRCCLPACPHFSGFLPQRQEDGHNRLKRVILIGDHHQLPPVVKNMAIQQYSHLDQSLFTRFIRLGTPYIELNAQV